MAQFYDVPILWKDKSTTQGRGIGNNAAWLCRCGLVLVGPHEGSIQNAALPLWSEIQNCPRQTPTLRWKGGRAVNSCRLEVSSVTSRQDPFECGVQPRNRFPGGLRANWTSRGL